MNPINNFTSNYNPQISMRPTRRREERDRALAQAPLFH